VIVQFNEVMACKVRQFSNGVSANQGRYLDLKLHPEQAAELPEAKEWPALGQFIAAVNRAGGFRTSGCMATGVTPGGHPAPYVDIFLDQPLTRTSPKALRKLASALEELNDGTTVPNLTLELCNSAARLPDGEEIQSVRLWFIGTRDVAERAFPLIIAKLQEQRLADYIPVAEQDDKERKQAAIRRFTFFLGWLVFAATSAFMASRYGWLGGIGGAIAGFVLYPIALFIVLIACWRLQRWWQKS
jgi:hypothetical protein